MIPKTDLRRKIFTAGLRVFSTASLVACLQLVAHPMTTHAAERHFDSSPSLEGVSQPAPGLGKQAPLRIEVPSLQIAETSPFVPPPPTTDAAGLAGSELDEELVPPAPSFDEPRTTHFAEEEWTIEITPGPSRSAKGLIANYQEIYNAIPYRRVEYLANPSYRHDTTVEVLFGQMRPTTIHRTDSPQRVVNPRPQLTQPYPLSLGELDNYGRFPPYSFPLPLVSSFE